MVNINNLFNKLIYNNEVKLTKEEASLLADIMIESNDLVEGVYKWASRPTKDGAKILRKQAGRLDNLYGECKVHNRERNLNEND